MRRTDFEKSQAIAAGRELCLPKQRIFRFAAERFMDVCPSERSDAYWIVIASKTLPPKDELILADELSDFVAYYGWSTEGLDRVTIPSAPKPYSPYQGQGKWKSGLVYFIQGVDGGPIKIGFSTNIYGRIFNLQTASPVKLMTISCFPASMDDEQALHKVFKYCHSHLEWFHPDPSLVMFAKAFRLLYPHFTEISARGDKLSLPEKQE